MAVEHSDRREGRGATPVQLVLTLCRRLLAMGRRRVGMAIAFNASAGLVEGAGVLALPPLLRLMGVGGDGAAVEPGRLLLALAGYVVLVAASALLARTRAVAVQSLSLEFLDRLRHTLHRAILAMDWSRFRSRRAADLQQVMTGEVSRISFAVSLLGTLSGLVIGMPFVLVATVILSPVLTLLALLVAVGVGLLTRRLGGAGFRLGRELGRVNRAAMADLADDLAGLRIIKSFGAEQARSDGLSARFADIRANQLAHARNQATERAALQIAVAVAAAVALVAALLVLRLPLAQALVLILAYGRLLQMALRALTTWRQLTNAVAALATYDETLAACQTWAEPMLPGPAPRPVTAIRLRGVCADYQNDAATVRALHGVDADLPAGGITALVGPSGAGKSTLADLIAGLTAPDAGEIRVDDQPLAAGLRHAWRGQVAVVPQDAYLFHDTIAGNLRLARPAATEAELWEVLGATAAADFVRALPDGLMTIVGDRGLRLSGGERQRVVLARALLRRPVLLVLDEATASLDGATEAEVADTLRGLRGRCTMLVVAHRPSTVRAADHVLLLEAGRVTAAGPWSDLQAQVGGRLADLGLAFDGL